MVANIIGEPGEEALRSLRKFYKERDPDFDKKMEWAKAAADLVDLRRMAGFTQKELAGLMGVPQVEVAKIESGLADPKWSIVREYLKGIAKGKPADEFNLQVKFWDDLKKPKSDWELD